jgi:hypothetical protein
VTLPLALRRDGGRRRLSNGCGLGASRALACVPSVAIHVTRSPHPPKHNTLVRTFGHTFPPCDLHHPWTHNEPRTLALAVCVQAKGVVGSQPKRALPAPLVGAEGDGRPRVACALGLVKAPLRPARPLQRHVHPSARSAHASMCVCMCARVHVHVSVCVPPRVCVTARERVSVCVCVCVCVCARARAQAKAGATLYVALHHIT